MTVFGLAIYAASALLYLLLLAVPFLAAATAFTPARRVIRANFERTLTGSLPERQDAMLTHLEYQRSSAHHNFYTRAAIAAFIAGAAWLAFVATHWRAVATVTGRMLGALFGSFA